MKIHNGFLLTLFLFQPKLNGTKKGVTFNPYGNLDKILQQKANDLGQEIEINPEKLINYRHEEDILSNFPHLGVNYTIPTNFIKLQSNFYSNHDIKSLNSSIQRYPDEIIHNNETKYFPKINPTQINKEKM